nr:hypothetical protein [uncultured Cupriavidus sp.]
MATNDFLVFGGGAGANVIAQVTYSGLAARMAGFSAGVAQSAQLNKVWRQSSIMSAVLAQFVSDLTGQDVLDDGTTATILANLKAGVRAQSIGVVGTMRNGKMSVAAASASATFSADEVVVESALGGLAYRVPSFSKTINLATTGAGGMDTGAAPTNGFVALYAIYNPTTSASALLATNATSAVQPEVYGGANMPAGYTASALVSVWPTNASGQLKVGQQYDRRIDVSTSSVITTTTAGTTDVSIAAIAPRNAKFVKGYMAITATGSGNAFIVLIPTSTLSVGQVQQNVSPGTGGGIFYQSFSGLMVVTPQQIRYTFSGSAGTVTFDVGIGGFEF